LPAVFSLAYIKVNVDVRLKVTHVRCYWNVVYLNINFDQIAWSRIYVIFACSGPNVFVCQYYI